MSFKPILAACAAAIVFSAPSYADTIMIQDAYARSATATAKTGAAFMSIMNHGAEDDRLIAVSSPVAKLVQLHTHLENNMGVMKMVHVEDGFDLPVGGLLMLERGGNHVMMMGLTQPFEQGETIPVTLTFEKAGEITVDVVIDRDRKAGLGAGHSHSD